MRKSTIDCLRLLESNKDDITKQICYGKMTIRNASQNPNIDKTAYLKYYDKLTNEWKGTMQ